MESHKVHIYDTERKAMRKAALLAAVFGGRTREVLSPVQKAIRKASNCKYPNQHMQYLHGAWKGDGSQSVETRQSRRRKQRKANKKDPAASRLRMAKERAEQREAETSKEDWA